MFVSKPTGRDQCSGQGLAVMSSTPRDDLWARVLGEAKSRNMQTHGYVSGDSVREVCTWETAGRRMATMGKSPRSPVCHDKSPCLEGIGGPPGVPLPHPGACLRGAWQARIA